MLFLLYMYESARNRYPDRKYSMLRDHNDDTRTITPLEILTSSQQTTKVGQELSDNRLDKAQWKLAILWPLGWSPARGSWSISRDFPLSQPITECYRPQSSRTSLRLDLAYDDRPISTHSGELRRPISVQWAEVRGQGDGTMSFAYLPGITWSSAQLTESRASQWRGWTVWYIIEQDLIEKSDDGRRSRS